MMNDESRELEMSDESESRLRFRKVPPFRSYLQLMRLPNVFTAMADVAMGFLFVQSPAWTWHPWRDGWTLLLLIAASVALYTAGMVLNDVFDLELDRRQRSERPIPSGRVSLRAARRLGWNLLMLGVTLGIGAAFFAGHAWPGVVAALLAANIVLYDAWLEAHAGWPAGDGRLPYVECAVGHERDRRAVGS